MCRLRIANCSGFYGDRLSAAREMVEGGPIDVLTGDWLAELTMLILAGNRLKGRPGYAPTFLRQLEDVLGTCLDRGIKIVSNAGGLDPAGCAEAVHELAARLGLSRKVAHVDRRRPHRPRPGPGRTPTPASGCRAAPLTANAYLGGRPIAAALSRGRRRGGDRPRHGRRAGDRAGHLAVRLAAATTWTAGRLGGRRPHHRVRLPGHRRQLRVLPGRARPGALRLPDRRAARRRLQRDHQASRDRRRWSRSARSRRSCSTRSPSPRYPARTWWRASTRSGWRSDGPDRVRVSGVRGEPPPGTLKVARQLPGRLPQHHDPRPDRPGPRGQGPRRAEEAHLGPGPKESFDEVDVELTPTAGTAPAADHRHGRRPSGPDAPSPPPWWRRGWPATRASTA